VRLDLDQVRVQVRRLALGRKNAPPTATNNQPIAYIQSANFNPISPFAH
jgi:hypothetical protein